MKNRPELDRYRRATDASPTDTARTIAAASARVAARRAPVWPGVAAMVLAAVALVAVVHRPAPVPEVELASEAPTTTVTPEEITLASTGAGTLAGDTLRWEQGSVHVEVPPGRGLSFRVETREATVRVIGTGFTVARDVLGTRVDVAHGRVAVACADGTGTELGAGDTHTCLPTAPGALLARARALAPSTDALDALARGLAAAPDPSTRAELLYVRASVRMTRGEPDAARTDLDALLALGPSPRRIDAQRRAARLAIDADDCAAAAPWLAALLVNPREPVDYVLHARCAPADVARADLEAALAATPPGPDAEALRQRIALLEAE